jgi:hypothetical protein
MNPWLTEIQAVAHDAGCGSGATIDMEYGFPHLTRDPCSCSRDARLAAGVEAVEAYDITNPPHRPCSLPCDACDFEVERQRIERLAAFREASRG